MVNNKLPIKVVPQLEHDFYKPRALGGRKKIFGDRVTREQRHELAGQVSEIKNHFAEAFKEFPKVPAVARVKVKKDAVAKSHRPESLLSASTCPIIGVEGMGEFLLSVTPHGLDNLARRIENDQSHVGLANISTLLEFNPYEPLAERPADSIAKVKLFRHNSPRFDAEIDKMFFAVLEDFGIHAAKEMKYGLGLKIFRVPLDKPDLYEALSSYVGVQSVGPFPFYEPVRSASIPVRALAAADFPPPLAETEYPVVGILDSGTNPFDTYLAPWRVGRHVYVPGIEQDNSHGSFVAGLVAHGRHMNHNDLQFPSCSSKFVDVVVLGKEPTSEDILLDRLQDEFGVTFILAAGNYSQKPYRGWPAEDLGEDDRICAPADSIRSVVVGSTAHRDHATSRVKSGHPSPFSRRGPGPLYLPKPELSHLGGNCSSSGSYSQIGILSIDGQNNVAEDIGTSFATPIVSNLFANVNHQILGNDSQLLTRALLIHSAALRGSKIDPIELRYKGFGQPPDIDEIIGCEPWNCTMIFDLEIAPKVAYEKGVFPMPKCLFATPDILKANILMTLVHKTSLDASFGSEYCRTNLEVSLGTYDVGTDGKKHQVKRVPADPILTGSGFEGDLVKYGFKWSPVKVYRREMVQGVKGTTWRLDLSIHHRGGFEPTTHEQAVLIITLADPAKKAPVYDEMVVQMNNLGWLANDLQLRTRLRP